MQSITQCSAYVISECKSMNGFGDDSGNTTGISLANETINIQYNEPYTTFFLRTVGVLAFLLNLFAFVNLKRLCKNRIRENSFHIQLTFICANDCGCGLFINLLSIPVTDVITVYVCGFSFIIVNVLTCMAQGNIFFICLQRYVFARNVRATSNKWKIYLSKTLLVVNGTIGVATLSFYLYFPLYEEYRDSECTLGVYKDNAKTVASMLIFVGLPTMLASDVLCILSIWKLSRLGSVAPGARSVSGPSSSYQDTSLESSTVNLSQKRAITTIVLILIAFNLSVAPSFIRIVLSHFQIRFKLEISRLLVFCIFGNSVANPIIYITRIQSLRALVVKDMSMLKNYFRKENN